MFTVTPDMRIHLPQLRALFGVAAVRSAVIVAAALLGGGVLLSGPVCSGSRRQATGRETSEGRPMGKRILFTQVDAGMPDSESSGLPPIGAADDVVYRVADGLSKMREKFNLPRDGVHCPICHVANVSPARLRTPCPKCGRPLLKFGWE